MPRISFIDKGYLIEHPFSDPLSQAQTHSYIFPGDELVLGHRLNFPTDASAANISNISFVSAKISLIAQKQNPYSEEYSRVYKSMRVFTLDSFTVTFDGINARLIQWGTGGADGYAPYVNFQADRNWKLPAGDIRRQINFFTEHVPSTSIWNYYFLFPTIFRWEDWISLAVADNDFFDISQTQDGLNQFWQHYFVSGKWLLKSRLDLDILVNGILTPIRSELNLTPGSNDADTYNSNSDWTAKSIKTCKAGGTPSNSPCFVYGNKYTEVHGYFSKVSGWGPDEQGTISAVIWIEPFKDVGLTSRTRASSLYNITPESVFFGLDTSITDDSGTGITDDSGEFITIDGGNGVLVWFDGINTEKVEFFALIDPVKLAAVYPGINKFTLYARLYDSTLDGGQTLMGEEIRQDCLLVNPIDVNDGCAFLQPSCPFNLDVFADASDSADFKNDKSDFYLQGDVLIQSIVMVLQKADDTCGNSWVDKQFIYNSSIGKFFDYGKANDFSNIDFIDDNGKKYTGLLLEWRKVLLAYGTGTYRVKIVTTDVFNNAVTTYDLRIFCLKAYNCNLINGSVKLEFSNIGFRGNLENPNTYIDYQGGWNSEIRLKGLFYEDNKPEYVNQYVQYGQAAFEKRKPYISEAHPKLVLELHPMEEWVHRYLKYFFLLSDELFVTDYNKTNVAKYPRFQVINSGFESLRQTYAASERLAGAKINLDYALNTLRKTNSQ